MENRHILLIVIAAILMVITFFAAGITQQFGVIGNASWYENNSLIGRQEGGNFIDGTGVTISSANNPGADRVDFTFDAQAYDTVQEEGVPLIQRRTINFVGGALNCVDTGSITECSTGGGPPKTRQQTYDDGSDITLSSGGGGLLIDGDATTDPVLTITDTGTVAFLLDNDDETSDLDAPEIVWRNSTVAAGDTEFSLGVTAGNNFEIEGDDGARDFDIDSSGNVTLDQALRLEETGAGVNFISFAAPAALGADLDLVWNITVSTCTGDGNAGALTINGSNEIICSSDEGGGGGNPAYEFIDDEGTPLTARRTLNFIGYAVSCVDDAGGAETDCTIAPTLQDVYTNSSPALIEIDGIAGSFRIDGSVETNFASLTIIDDATLGFGPPDNAVGILLDNDDESVDQVSPGLRFRNSTVAGGDDQFEFFVDATGNFILNNDSNNRVFQVDGNDDITINQELRFEETGAGSNFISIVAPASLTADRTCVLEDDSTPFDSCVSSGGGGGFVERHIVFFISGNVTTGVKPIRYFLRRSVTYKDAHCEVQTPGSGGNIIINFQENGVDIFSGADRVTISAGADGDTSGAPDDTLGAVTNIIELIVDFDDSGNTGADLTCELRIRNFLDSGL